MTDLRQADNSPHNITKSIDNDLFACNVLIVNVLISHAAMAITSPRMRRSVFLDMFRAISPASDHIIQVLVSFTMPQLYTYRIYRARNIRRQTLPKRPGFFYRTITWR